MRLEVHGTGETFRDCANVCPDMVVIPPGHFQMGSPPSETGRGDNEGPVHDVTIGYAFSVSKFPITRGEWRRYVAATGRTGSSCQGYIESAGTYEQKAGFSWRAPGFPQDDRHPVVCVSWNETQQYASWLTEGTHHRYRLLSEAEYEYVNRAGSRGTYFWGNTADDLCRYANAGIYCRGGYRYTSPVGSFKPNGFGLFDTTGNVESWAQDCDHDDYSGAPTDGSAWIAGDCIRRVVKGGSWVNNPRYLHAAGRAASTAPSAYNYWGFRLARDND
jgi:formylglycine-generating enzyme required for sulfatase activity